MKSKHLQLTGFFLILAFSTYSQNVGINTTSPAFDLHVQGDQYLSGNLYFDTYLLTKLFKSGGNFNIETEANLNLKPSEEYDVAIFDGNTKYATFEGNSQSLGIGISAPQEKLDVIGNIQTSDSLFFGNSNTYIAKDVSDFVSKLKTK